MNEPKPCCPLQGEYGGKVHNRYCEAPAEPIESRRDCWHCNGTGRDGKTGGIKRCRHCDGKGTVKR